MADSTTIGRDTAISGRIEGSADLSVEGYVEGTIELSETLTIAPGGRVDGQIQARQVVIEGSFDGDIVAEQLVVLTDTAQAIATINAPAVEMADGARLRGELSVGVDGDVEISTERPAPATAGRSRTTRTTTSPTPTASTGGGGRRTTTTASAATSTTRSPAATATAVVEESGSEAEEEEEPAPEEPSGAGEESYSDETFEQYRQDYTVKELRDELRDLDLQVSGTKDELIERLLTGED